MANLAPPSSQKAGVRPISFLLDSPLGGSLTFLDLAIRPEELTRTDPSRINVQQTLGGAWADSFGPGVTQITISGHTGWRRTEGDSDDGLARFLSLKETVFDAWHERRKVAAAAGLNPDSVKLVFSDALDDAAHVVAPMNFVLRRSKSRPLLAQYQIAMLALDDAETFSGDPFVGARGGLDLDILQAAGLDSLTASVDRITGMIHGVHAWVDAVLAAPVRAFMNQTARLYGAVRGAISAASGVAGALISVAQMTARAGINLFRTLAAVANIPQIAKAQLMAIASAYSNIFCVLSNALQQKQYIQDYGDVYGSSNCSSTAGGRPISSLAGENPFYKVVPTREPLPVRVSHGAQSALRTMASSDPVLAPMAYSSIGATVREITGGLVVA